MPEGARAGSGHWPNRAILAFAAAGFSVAVVGYILPFFAPVLPGADPTIGLQIFRHGVFALTHRPWPGGALYFASFSLTPIVACVGLVLQRGHGRVRLVGGVTTGAFGFVALANPYFLDPTAGWAYGYFITEVGFLVATVAAAARLMREWRLAPPWMGWFPERAEPAASASQEALARARGER